MLSQGKYLIKCKKDKFKTLINENDIDIMKVLLKEDLNRIFIFNKRNFICVLSYENYDNYFCINNNNHNNLNEND